MASLQFELPPIENTDPKPKSSTPLTFDLPDVGVSGGPAVTVGDRYLDSQYDVGTTVENNPEVYRKERQGVMAELGNGIARTALKIPVSVLGNLGAIADLEDYNNQDNEVGNWLSDAAERSKANISEALPVYGGNKTLDLGSREYWMDNGANLLESVGQFAITGYGLGRGLTMLNNIGKATQIGQFAGATLSAVALNQAESIPTAMSIYKDTYQANLQKGLSDDDAKQEAADAAAYSININRLNIPLNLTSSYAFLRSAKTLKGISNASAQKRILSELDEISTFGSIRNSVSEGLQESLEESINTVAEREGRRKGMEGKDYSYNFVNTVSDVFSEEGIQSALLGFLGGQVQTLATAGLNQATGVNRETQSKLNLQLDALKRLEVLGSSQGLPTIKRVLENLEVQSDLINKIEQATLIGDTPTVDNLKNDLLAYQSLQAFKDGTSDQLVDIYRSIQNDTESEIKLGDDYKTKATQAITQIRNWENTYNKLNNTFHPDVVEELFTNRVKRESVKKQAIAKQADVLRYEGELEISKQLGMTDVEAAENLEQARAEFESLREQSEVLDSAYSVIKSPEYLLEKQTQKAIEQQAKQEVVDQLDQKIVSEEIANRPLEIGEEVLHNGEPVKIASIDNGTVFTEGSDVGIPVSEITRPESQEIVNGNPNPEVPSFPEDVVSSNPEVNTPEVVRTKAEKEVMKAKTAVTNLAYKSYEQNPDGTDAIDENGNRIRNRVSFDVSSPNLPVGTDLIFRLVPTRNETSTEPEIVVAFKDAPDKELGYIHEMKWVNAKDANGEPLNVAPESYQKIYEETLAIREAVMNSPNGQVEGVMRDKKFGFKNITMDRTDINNYKRSVVDVFGIQTGPNDFNGASIVYADKKKQDADSENPYTPQRTHIKFPSPIKGRFFVSYLKTENAGKLGLSEVISQSIEDGLANGKIAETVAFVNSLLPNKTDDSKPLNTFRVENKAGKIRVTYGNSVFNQGDKFNKAELKTFLDKKEFNVDTSKLNSSEEYQTYQVKDGKVIPSVKYPNYSAYLASQVLKTNIYPEFTSNNERVFTSQVNIELGLKESIPVVGNVKVPKNPLLAAIKNNQISTALDVIGGTQSYYSEIAKILAPLSLGLNIRTDSKLKARGQYSQGTVTVNPSRNKGIDQLDEAIVHEVIHGVTVGKIEQYLSGNTENLAETEIAAIEELEALRAYARENLDFAQEELNYGLETLPEFVAMGLSNKVFQETLNELDYDKDKSWLYKLFDVIQKIVGINVKPGTVLEATLHNAMSLIESPVNESSAVYNLPTFKRNSTGDTVTDAIIGKLDDRRRLLQDQRNELNKTEIDLEIWKIGKQIGGLYGSGNTLKTYRDDLRDVSQSLKGPINATTLLQMLNKLDAWTDSNEIMRFPEDSRSSKTLAELNGERLRLKNQWLERARTYQVEVANKEGGRLTANDLRLSDDIDVASMYAVDGGVSKVALELEQNRLIKTAYFKEREEYTQKLKEIDQKVKDLGGLTKGFYTDMLQEKPDGTPTGNLLDEYTYEYYEQLAQHSPNTKEGLEWLRANTRQGKIDNEAYKSDRDRFIAYLQFNRDNYKTEEVFKQNYDKQLVKWERQNSPIARIEAEDQVLDGSLEENSLSSMKGSKYIGDPVPLSKWKDPKYAALTGKKKEFYDYFKSTFKEYLPYISGKMSIADNTIPELQASIVEDWVKDGAGKTLQTVGKRIKEAFIRDDEYSNVEGNNLDPVTRLPLRRLRVKMIGNNLSPAEKSYDLGKVLKEWVKTGAEIKYRGQYQDRVLLAEKLLNFVKRPEKVDGKVKVDWRGEPIESSEGLVNTKKRVAYTTDFYFGMRKANEGNLGKMGDAVIRFTQANTLALNFPSALNNLFFGQISNFLHSAGGQDFSDRQVTAALGTMLNTVTDPKLRKKVTSVMSKLQLLEDVRASDSAIGEVDKWFYIMQTQGEKLNQGSVLIATLKNTFIKDKNGKQVDLWSAFDENGNVDEKTYPNSGYSDIDGKSSPQTIQIANKIIEINRSVHGDYDLRSAKLMKKNILGRMLSIFRNFIPRAIQSRFGAERQDPLLGRAVKGRYRTIFTDSMVPDLQALKNTLLVALRQTPENVSPLDLANMKMIVREFQAFAILYGVSMLLKASLDDDDQPVLTYFLNVSNRVNSELTTFINPADALELVKQPSAVLRPIGDVINLVSATKDNVIHGEDKDLAKKTLKLIPLGSQYNRVVDVFSKELGQ